MPNGDRGRTGISQNGNDSAVVLERIRSAIWTSKAEIVLRAFCLALVLIAAGARIRANPVNWDAAATVASGGWGRMIALTTGSWLAVSTVFPPGTNSYLSILASSNSCRSWTAISQVKEAGRTLDNGELIALPDGTELLTMRSLIKGVSYRLPVYRSTDSGASWQPLSNIDSSSGPGGLWEPDFWLLKDGSLAVFYSNETHSNYSQIISERVSQDGGATWGNEIWACYQSGGGSLRPGMPQIARMNNGSYILVYEIVGINNADVYYKVSTNGVDWPIGLGTHIPCQHAGPFVMCWPDGQVFVTSCENQLSASRDYGVTWQKLDPSPWNLGFEFSWPALYQTGSNEIGAMVTSAGVKLRFGNVLPLRGWPNPFSDDFNDGTDQNWTHYGGNFAVTNGTYALNDAGTYGKSLAGSEFWTDGSLEADVRINTPGNAGLLFRVTNPDYTGPDDGFDYYIGLDTDGFVIFGRQADAWTPLTSTPFTVATNVWYHMKITMRGDVFRVYVGDMTQPKITINDGSFARGQIGVRAFQCDAQFDNVSFTNSAPEALNLERNGGRLLFSWPYTAVNVKLYGTTTLNQLSSGSPIAGSPALSNGQWNLSLPQATLDRKFFWLQGE